MAKTPVPLECFLEPPGFLVKIVGKYHRLAKTPEITVLIQNFNVPRPFLKATSLFIGSVVSADLRNSCYGKRDRLFYQEFR